MTKRSVYNKDERSDREPDTGRKYTDSNIGKHRHHRLRSRSRSRSRSRDRDHDRHRNRDDRHREVVYDRRKRSSPVAHHRHRREVFDKHYRRNDRREIKLL
mgnify:CR=1 FL=1